MTAAWAVRTVRRPHRWLGFWGGRWRLGPSPSKRVAVFRRPEADVLVRMAVRLRLVDRADRLAVVSVATG